MAENSRAIAPVVHRRRGRVALGRCPPAASADPDGGIAVTGEVWVRGHGTCRIRARTRLRDGGTARLKGLGGRGRAASENPPSRARRRVAWAGSGRSVSEGRPGRRTARKRIAGADPPHPRRLLDPCEQVLEEPPRRSIVRQMVGEHAGRPEGAGAGAGQGLREPRGSRQCSARRRAEHRFDPREPPPSPPVDEVDVGVEARQRAFICLRSITAGRARPGGPDASLRSIAGVYTLRRPPGNRRRDVADGLDYLTKEKSMLSTTSRGTRSNSAS